MVPERVVAPTVVLLPPICTVRVPVNASLAVTVMATVGWSSLLKMTVPVVGSVTFVKEATAVRVVRPAPDSKVMELAIVVAVLPLLLLRLAPLLTWTEPVPRALLLL